MSGSVELHMGLGITELVGTGENVPVGYVDGSKGGINGVNGFTTLL